MKKTKKGKELTLEDRDKVCEKVHHDCENCPLSVENNVYGSNFRECAFSYHTLKIRDEYREMEFKK